MITDINEYTQNHLTASFSMGYHEIIYLEGGNRSFYWSYIKGELIPDAGGLYFERFVFDAYEGEFW